MADEGLRRIDFLRDILPFKRLFGHEKISFKTYNRKGYTRGNILFMVLMRFVSSACCGYALDGITLSRKHADAMLGNDTV
jgi:hypothetical protein